MVGQPQANFPSDNPFKAVHQALLQARVISQDSHRSVGSNERKTGIFPVRGAAPDASGVLQHIEDVAGENAILQKQIDATTKMVGHFQQHSRSLMHQLQREVSRSRRLEEQLVDDFDLPQFEATGSVSTTEVGASTCTAEAAARGEASAGITDVPACLPSLSACDEHSQQTLCVD